MCTYWTADQLDETLFMPDGPALDAEAVARAARADATSCRSSNAILKSV